MARTPPLIGITGRAKIAAEMGAPYSFASAPMDVYLSEYATAVASAGALPVHLPLGVDDRILDRLDGLLLVGGDDVDPRLYGQAPGPHSGDIDPRRDQFELRMLRGAITRELPVLAICRGMQLLNVAQGGSLIPHLAAGEGESHGMHVYPRNTRVHDVHTESGSTVRDCYGASTRVNSFHHQAVDVLGSGLAVTGRSPDGVVETIELVGHDVVGVQWHPEVFLEDPIFEWLAAAAASASEDEKKDEAA